MALEAILLTSLPIIGGLVGYFLRPWIDEKFARRGEARAARRKDLEKQRDLLLDFLGGRRAHFQWLFSIAADELNTGEPPAHEKVRSIAEWVYDHRPHFPREIQGELNLIMNASYGLLQPDSEGYRWARGGAGTLLLTEAWRKLEAYAERLRRELTGTED